MRDNAQPSDRRASPRRKPRTDAPTPEVHTATHVLIDQLPAMRQRRGLTGAQLAARCAELGAPKIDRNVIGKIETRTRGVSLDEAIVLAYALDCSPLHLICPPEDGEMVQITADRAVLAWELRAWLRGAEPLRGQDEQAFAAAMPPAEWRERRARRTEAEQRASTIRRQIRVLRKKADLVASDLAGLESPLAGPAGFAPLNPHRRRLEAKLEAIYDEMAELAVDLDDYETQAADLDGGPGPDEPGEEQ